MEMAVSSLLNPRTVTHLKALEAESIHIIREVAAEFENPVMLYSIGKDSTVMLRLAQKAFSPAPLPFPLLHVDTTFKFREMYAFRDQVVAETGIDHRIHKNPEAIAQNNNTFVQSNSDNTKTCT